RLALVDRGGVFREIPRTARRVSQMLRLGALQKEERDVGRLRFRRVPVRGSLARRGDLDGRNGLAADERPEVQQPLLAERPDVDEHAVQRAEAADRVRSVFEHTRRPHGGRRREVLTERMTGRQVVVQLFVVAAALAWRGERLLPEALRETEPWPE